MKKYDSYKNSSVEWIKEIPSNWNLSRLKFQTSIKTGNSLNDELKEKYSRAEIQGLEYIGSKDIDVQTARVNYDNGLVIPFEDIDNFKVAKTGSTLICIEGGSAGKKIALVDRDVCYVNKLAALPFDNKFIYFFTQSHWFNQKFQSKLSGLISGVSVQELKNFEIVTPPVEEQTQIANYLEYKTSKIDNLIRKKEQLIELLKEERTAIINQAVTKGLDPNVPMKDSGIEWLGEIPENWEFKKLRYVGTCQNGISEGAEFFGSGNPFVSYSDVYKNDVLPESVKGLAQSDGKQQEHYSVEENDIFFTRTSETIEEIGIASTCMKTIEKSIFAGFLIRFRPNKNLIYKGFSKYYFRCFIPRVFFVKEMNLVTRASLSQELLKRLPVVLPTISEQIEIGAYLDKKTTHIDKTIENMMTEITLLKEYKRALISEVVTGKVDVRDEIIN